MNTLLPKENFMNKEKIIEELLKGKESAEKLHILLQKPVENYGSDLADELSVNIFNSFTQTLSMVNENIHLEFEPCDVNESSPKSSGGNRIKKLGPSERRGCYTRRKATESLIIVSATIDDGYGWRKYGQKDIQNSEYPRCYYRCTHKFVQGCKATKQVQKTPQDSLLYQISYFGHHTCNINTSKSPKIISHVDPIDSCLLNFKSEPKTKPDTRSTTILINPTTFSKETQSDGTVFAYGDKSSVLSSCLWEDMNTSDSFTRMMASEMGSDNCHEEELVSSFATQESFRVMDLVDFNRLVDLENGLF